ncbi:hypothetical protein CDAR_501421 [Caerostris darwini]|uniref:C2H2-type domain-containing protein n=1 Tax=Caerostris darwini TaxID=1538125 RepID=A0AAV4PT43_9ARAC|nr:hypothetical protein CDAR_501421 [Caerostris darwini]
MTILSSPYRQQLEPIDNNLRIHDGEKPFWCLVWDSSEEDYIDTSNFTENCGKQHKCPLCPYVTDSDTQYRDHLIGHFPIKMRFARRSPGSNTSVPFALTSHLMCSATSLDAQSLKMNYQSSGGGDEQFLSQKKSKKIHQCPYCPYSSINGCHVRDHIFRHTGQKPHQCHICQKQSRTKSDLKKHFLTHLKSWDPTKSAS